jgi:hypothetical protein
MGCVLNMFCLAGSDIPKMVVKTSSIFRNIGPCSPEMSVAGYIFSRESSSYKETSTRKYSSIPKHHMGFKVYKAAVMSNSLLWKIVLCSPLTVN